LKSRAVAWWRQSLRAVAVLNIALWSLAAVAVAGTDVSSHLQLLLSAGYVAGCAFRCFLPLVDIPRIALVDSPLSRVSIGRSVATVAELCFAAQWAGALHRLASFDHNPFVQAVSMAMVPLIVLAEGCSWYAVLTTRQRPHAAENSLWGLSAALVVSAMLAIGPQGSAALHSQVIAGGTLYVAFIFVYDVPMYWARWRSDQALGRRYLTIPEGWVDVGRRSTVSYRWADWKNEIPWMSLYFTFGVWSSIWLVHASLPARH
jgi:hypothetical protein